MTDNIEREYEIPSFRIKAVAGDQWTASFVGNARLIRTEEWGAIRIPPNVEVKDVTRYPFPDGPYVVHLSGDTAEYLHRKVGNIWQRWAVGAWEPSDTLSQATEWDSDVSVTPVEGAGVRNTPEPEPEEARPTEVPLGAVYRPTGGIRPDAYVWVRVADGWMCIDLRGSSAAPSYAVEDADWLANNEDGYEAL